MVGGGFHSVTLPLVLGALLLTVVLVPERRVGNGHLVRQRTFNACPTRSRGHFHSRNVAAKLIKDPNLLKGSDDQEGRKPAGMPGNGLVGMNSDAERMEWDPEGLLGPRQGGHIDRLEAQKTEERNKAEYERMAAEQKKEIEEARKRREARVIPEDPLDKEAVINYFLDTNPFDMEYEIARLRPAITDELLHHMDTIVNTTRLNTEPVQADLDQMYEYEALSQVLKEGVIIFDTMKQEALRNQKNLKILLGAADKKAALLQLAGENAIDDSFILLLDSNAQAAKDAGQDKIADFILKIRAEATRYVIKPLSVPLRENEIADATKDQTDGNGQRSSNLLTE